MFSRRALSRTRKRTPTRHVRGVLEVLETRKLMAGDLNMGSYVIGGGSLVSDPPPAVVQSTQVAPVKSTVAAPIVGTLDPLAVDAALKFDQPETPQSFLPGCPAVPSDNGLADALSLESGDAEPTLTDPVKLVSPPQAIGTLGGSRDRIGASARATQDNRVMYPLSAAAIESDNLLTVSGASEAATHRSTMGEEGRYFVAGDTRPSIDGPSLVNQSLSPYVQSDTFMAMGLLPSPLTSDQNEDAAGVIPSDGHSYQTQAAQFDAWLERQDLNTLRDDASAIDIDPIVDPLPFRGAGTNPISAAISSFVGMDFYDLDSESSEQEDASLINKLNKNRFQFAAFAFVFTMVTVRMNSADSKRANADSARDLKTPPEKN